MKRELIYVAAIMSDNGFFMYGKDSEARMSGDREGRNVRVKVWDDGNDSGSAVSSVAEHGGYVSVFGKGNDTSRAVMGVNEYGHGAISTCDKNGYRLASLK